jgi:acetyltransferase-like isoleucine patch superfamily enzyme
MLNYSSFLKQLKKPWILFGLLRMYQHYFRSRIDKAWGMVALSQVRHKGIECLIHGRTTLYDPKNLRIGDFVRIGGGCFLFCKGGLVIGSNTQISRNVCIYTANHNILGSMIPYDETYIKKSVLIGKSVWIGMNVCITPGVSIGDGAVIGMGTVVSRDVSDGAIIVGSPSRIVGYRDMEDFRKKDNNNLLFGKKHQVGKIYDKNEL